MRWRKRYNRVVKRFALFPIKAFLDDIRLNYEYRWLETVYLRQTKEYWFFGTIPHWKTVRFVNKGEYITYRDEILKEKEENG